MMKLENILTGFVDSLEVKESAVEGNLFIVYLNSSLSPKVDYLTLDEALNEGSVMIRELDTATISDFRVENRSDRRVLLLMGEELQGEKQNRTINTSILVGAHQEIIIPVSCTEQGRWAPSGTRLKSEHLLHPRVRANLAEDVSDTLRHARSYCGKQHKLWGRVALALEDFAVQSPTAAIDDVYSTYDETIDEMVKKFRTDCIGNGILGSTEELIAIDAFTRKETLPRIWNKLIKSYLLDSIPCRMVREMRKEEVSEFLTNIKDAKFEVYDSPGLGESVRIKKNGLCGSCLVYEGEVIHLSLFEQRASNKKRDFETPLMSPIRRFRSI